MIKVEKVEKVINTIGCGDSFTAGLTASLLKGLLLEESIKEGHKTACKNLTTVTPGSLI